MTQDGITEKVRICLDNDFITRKCLLRNILSLRALARYLILKLELKEKNMDAVISAIRRYKKTQKEKSDEGLKKILSKISVKTRSDIVDIRVQKNKKSVDGIIRLNSAIDVEKGEILRMIQAEQSITVIIDNKNLDKFFAVFGKSECISVDKNLVEINLQFTEDAQSVKGITAIVSSSFNSEGINIVEIMSSAPELILIIKKDDLIDALKVVDNLQELQ